MYARVTTLEWQEGHKQEGVGEVIRILRESIVPTARQQQGFKDFLALRDRAGGSILMITLWETEAALQASEASGYYDEQVHKLAFLFHLHATPPYRLVYEVVIQPEAAGWDQPAAETQRAGFVAQIPAVSGFQSS